MKQLKEQVDGLHETVELLLACIGKELGEDCCDDDCCCNTSEE